MKRIAVLLVLALLLVGLLPGAHAAGSLFFVGVNNDIPVLLSGDTSPFYANGKLYAPYTVFNAGPGGINVSYDPEQETFVLFTLSNTIAYDLSEETISFKGGETYSVEIIYRNGILYIPIEQAAQQFGLSVSLITSKSGCGVLRFKDGTEIYDDEQFLEKSEMFISHMLDTYGEQELGNDVLSENEEVGEQTEPESGATEVYLVLIGDAVSRSTLGHLEALEYVSDTKVFITFYVTQAQILADKQLIRDIYNGGHQIGVYVDTAENAAEVLKATNELLDQTVFSKSAMAFVPQEILDLPSYCTISFSQTMTSVEEVLNNQQPKSVLVCQSDVAYVLEQLTMRDISILQLQENTKLPEHVEVSP